MIEKLEKINSLIYDVLYEELKRKDVCILAIRVAKVLLNSLGYEVKPLPVKVGIYNKKWDQFVRETGGQPKSEVDAMEWANKGAWAVGIGMTHEDNENNSRSFGVDKKNIGYNGHLVAIVDNEYLLDPTIGQASRPEYDIHLGPLITKINKKSFIHGTSNLIGMYGSSIEANPVIINYFAIPGDKSYKQTPDWKSNRITTFVEKIMQKIS